MKSVRSCGRLLGRDATAENAIGGFTSAAGAAGLAEVPQGATVRLSKGSSGPVAGYGNLITCGSVWACPRCSAVIAAERAAGMGEAIRTCVEGGGSAYLLTLTLSHSTRDGLTELWDAVSSGWRALFGVVAWTGKAERFERGRLRAARLGQREVFDVAGTARYVELTGGGPSGWHVHIHAIVFSASPSWAGVIGDTWRETFTAWGLAGTAEAVTDERSYRAWLARNAFAASSMDRWRKGLRKKGFDCGAAGVDVRPVDDYGAECLGQYLAKATFDAAYDAANETASGQHMKSRRTGGEPPFRMLYAATMDDAARRWFLRTPRRWDIFRDDDDPSVWLLVDLDSAEVTLVSPPRAWRLWWEYETAAKGRRQMIWSQRVSEPSTRREVFWNRLLDARGAERDDAEVAADEIGGDVLGVIAASSWYRRMVVRPTWLADALESAERGGADGIAAWMAAHDVEWTPSG
ncbi:hypothetical protein [Gordonia malaquae]|uniref:hypothetical protein n=1 Tax=Gordonia malaquae TaxID=410332 RepID=UPI0030FF11B8